MKKYYKQIFVFYRMRIKKEKIINIENHQVYKITFTNKNNYVISFYNFGGYITIYLFLIIIIYMNMKMCCLAIEILRNTYRIEVI